MDTTSAPSNTIGDTATATAAAAAAAAAQQRREQQMKGTEMINWLDMHEGKLSHEAAADFRKSAPLKQRVALAAFGLGSYLFAVYALVQLVAAQCNLKHHIPDNWARFILFEAGGVSSAASAASAPAASDKGDGIVLGRAILGNITAFLPFFLGHNMFCRLRTKSIMAAFVHHRAERSVFALQAATLLMLALFLWTPLHTEIFSIPDRAYMRRTVWGLKCLSFLLFLASTFEIDHFELFGIKQSFGMGYHIHFVERFFYRVVRHPMMLFLLATFWFQPYITYGTLLQATVLTLWVVLSVHFFEEPDIAHKIGEDIYADYTQRVPFRYVPGFCPMRLSRTTKKIA